MNGDGLVAEIEADWGWPLRSSLEDAIPEDLEVSAYYLEQVWGPGDRRNQRTDILILSPHALLGVSIRHVKVEDSPPFPRFQTETVERCAVPLSMVRYVTLSYKRPAAHRGEDLPRPDELAVSIQLEPAPPSPLDRMTTLPTDIKVFRDERDKQQGLERAQVLANALSKRL